MMSDTRLACYLTYITNRVKTAKYPTHSNEILKYEDVRAWEETESGPLDQYKWLSEFKPPTNRSSLGIWVQYEIRLATIPPYILSNLEKPVVIDKETTFVQVVTKDELVTIFPYVSYGLKCRPENIDKMMEKIRNRQLIELKEGTVTEEI